MPIFIFLSLGRTAGSGPGLYANPPRAWDPSLGSPASSPARMAWAAAAGFRATAAREQARAAQGAGGGAWGWAVAAGIRAARAWAQAGLASLRAAPARERAAAARIEAVPAWRQAEAAYL